SWAPRSLFETAWTRGRSDIRSRPTRGPSCSAPAGALPLASTYPLFIAAPRPRVEIRAPRLRLASRDPFVVRCRGTGVTVLIERATAALAPAIALLRNDAADHLTEQYGRNYGSGHCSDRGVVADMKHGAAVYVARARKGLLGTMTLATRKPWAIDPMYFAESKRPLYLTNMAVAPAHQRTGVGRALLAEAAR